MTRTLLYRYLSGGVSALCAGLRPDDEYPLTSGAHADNSVDLQEFMIAPYCADKFSEALRMGVEVFHTLKGVLKKRGYSTAVGDEGGFAPNCKSNQEALEVVLEAITKAGFEPGKQIGIALDPASSEYFKDGKYIFKKSDKSERTSEQMVEFWEDWTRQFPQIVSIEDGMAEDDWAGWKMMTEALGSKIQLVGDDLFVTNTERLKRGIDEGISANSIPDQSEPDWHAHRDAEVDVIWRPRRATHRWCRTAPAKRKTRSSRTSLWQRMPARSRPAPPAAPTASPSTTSFCASKKNWARPPGLAWRRARSAEGSRSDAPEIR